MPNFTKAGSIHLKCTGENNFKLLSKM